MPDWSKEIRNLLAGLKLEPSREAEIVEELSQHLNDRYEELLGGGAAAEHAERTIRLELTAGGLDAQLKPLLPIASSLAVPGDTQPARLLAGMWKDLHYAARALRLNPGFTIVAILSLMLGIGANTAIFQLLDAVRLRSLPVQDPQELARVHIVKTDRTGAFRGQIADLTNDLWQNIRDHQQAFSSIAAWGAQQINLSQGGEERDAELMWASGNLFATLGVRPELGRLISASDDQPGCASPAAVISDSFWHSEYGGGAVIGHKVMVDGHPFDIIGVTPASFFGMEVGRQFDIALPVCAEPVIHPDDPLLKKHYGWWLSAVGRLKSGWTLERATAQLAAISPATFAATLPPEYTADDRKHYLGFKLEAIPASSGVSTLRTEYEIPLCLLMAISGLVLLIACANLANLMLARASARQREMAIRLALGASRGRLVRQMLAESALLAGIGTILGVGLAQVLSRVLVLFLSGQDNQWFLDLRPDAPVLAFAIGLAVLTCLLFGLMPAIRAARTAPGEAMKASARAVTAGRERFSSRRALVVSQVALSLVLVVGALLFVRTLHNLITLDAGFQQNHILFADVDFSPIKLPMESRDAYRQQLLEKVRAIPGVISAADVAIIPISGNGWNDRLTFPGRAPDKEQWANFNMVSPGYFKTLGTPMLAGRDFTEDDKIVSPLAAIVTEKFARKFFNGANPVGTTFSVVAYANKPERIYQIVGLVKDVKYQDLREDFTPIVFVAEAQDPEPNAEAQIALHSDEDLTDLLSSVKHVVAEVSPSLIIQFTSFHTLVRQGLLRERLMATLSGFFGLLAAILAMIGLYGVISYMVLRRRNEIGIRMALGANRSNILGLIMREAAVLLVIGAAIGTILALFGAKSASALLFGLQPRDPLTLLVAIGGLAMVAMLASFLPAQRASTIDPMQALRDE